MSYGTGDVHDRRREIDVARGTVKAHGDAALGLDSLELLEKIDVEVRAPIFAVGNSGKTCVFLEANDVADGGILDVAQLGATDFVLADAFARLEQRRGAQEAADVVGAKRRFGAYGHPCSSGGWQRAANGESWTNLAGLDRSVYDALERAVWKCAASWKVRLINMVIRSHVAGSERSASGEPRRTLRRDMRKQAVAWCRGSRRCRAKLGALGAPMLGNLVGVLFDGLAYGSLLFIISIGLSVTMGLMNFVNLAHGAFAMLGGYASVVVMSRLGVPFLAVVADRVRRRPRWPAPCSNAFSTAASIARPISIRCCFSIGLVFVAMAAATYIFGSQQQPVHAARIFARTGAFVRT